MKVAIIHPFLNTMGGAEFVGLITAKVLSSAGYCVTIFTNKEPDYKKAKERFGLDLKDLNIVVKRPFIEKMLSITGKFVGYRWVLVLSSLLNEARKVGYDIIIDTQTNVFTKSDIVYMHYVHKFKFRHESFVILYNKLIKRKLSFILGNPKIIVANSSWTAKQIREFFGRDSLIIHPPVDVGYYMKVWDSSRRERIVVTVSRLDPVKRLDAIVDIASVMRDYKFVIFSGSFKSGDVVLDKIRRKMKELKVDNIDLVIDAPRDKRRSIMAGARYYVHPPFSEPFGIAVVEAMAAGLIPIVYKNSGTWVDVVSKVSNILGYDSIEEVPQIIRRIDEDEQLYYEIRNKIKYIVNNFSIERFSEKILNVINMLI